jgi:hypothetical protein
MGEARRKLVSFRERVILEKTERRESGKRRVFV